MQRQPIFVATSRGFINLWRVLYIKAPERGLVRFVFTDNEYMDLPEAEAQQVETTMISELMICAD
jgi:hypothetical protein